MRKFLKFVIMSMIVSSLFSSAVGGAEQASYSSEESNASSSSASDKLSEELPLDDISEQGALNYFLNELKSNTGYESAQVESDDAGANDEGLNEELEMQLESIRETISDSRNYVGKGMTCMMEIKPDGKVILYDEATDNKAYLTEMYSYANISGISYRRTISEERLMEYIRDYHLRGNAATKDLEDEFRDSFANGDASFHKIYADQSIIQVVFILNDQYSSSINSLAGVLSKIEASAYDWATKDLDEYE